MYITGVVLIGREVFMLFMFEGVIHCQRSECFYIYRFFEVIATCQK